MNRPSSIWSPFEARWDTALTASDWQQRFCGPVPPTCAAWMRPGPRAEFVPCPHADGCGQPHRVRRLSDRVTWVGVPEEPDCESFALTESELATSSLDLDKLLHSIGHLLRLDSVAIERIQAPPSIFRIGHFGKTLAPCFFSVASNPSETSRATAALMLAHGGPVVVFVPLAGNIPTDLRTIMRERGGGCFGLDEVLDLDSRGLLIAKKTIASLIPTLATAKQTTTPRLVVPPDTPWSEIRLKLINGKTLVASFGNQTVQANADQLGQVARDNPDVFLLGWRTLVAFAAKGVLTGDEKALFPNPSDFKNRRSEVRDILRGMVSISSDPIRDLSKRPKEEDTVRKGDRTQRKLRKGFALIPHVEFIQGADLRLGHLSDLTMAEGDDADSADSYPRRNRQNSDEF